MRVLFAVGDEDVRLVMIKEGEKWGKSRVRKDRYKSLLVEQLVVEADGERPFWDVGEKISKGG